MLDLLGNATAGVEAKGIGECVDGIMSSRRVRLTCGCILDHSIGATGA